MLLPPGELDDALHGRDRGPARRAGADPPILGTDDEINARWRAEGGALTFDGARELGRRALERRMRSFENIAPERWDATIEAYARADGREHYAAHRSYLTTG